MLGPLLLYPRARLCSQSCGKGAVFLDCYIINSKRARPLYSRCPQAAITLSNLFTLHILRLGRDIYLHYIAARGRSDVKAVYT